MSEVGIVTVHPGQVVLQLLVVCRCERELAVCIVVLDADLCVVKAGPACIYYQGFCIRCNRCCRVCRIGQRPQAESELAAFKGKLFLAQLQLLQAVECDLGMSFVVREFYIHIRIFGLSR